MSSRAARSSAFERLKNRGTDNFNLDSDEEELEDFNPNALRDAMNEDDGGFIVDDDGRGYTGTYDDWMAEDKKANAREKGRKRNPRKTKATKPQPAKKPVNKIQSRSERMRERSRRNEARKSQRQTGISAFMGGSSSKKTTTRPSATTPRSQDENKKFLASVLDDLDDDSDEPIIPTQPRHRRTPQSRASARRTRQNGRSQPLAPIDNDISMSMHDSPSHDIDQKENIEPQKSATPEQKDDGMGPPCAKKIRLDPSVMNKPEEIAAECPSYTKMDLDDMNADIEQLEISARANSPPPAITCATGDSEIPTRPGCVTFFWLDAYEDVLHHPGSIFLFGKAVDPSKDDSSMVSCCVLVRNIQRSIFFLPRRINENDPKSERIDTTEVAKEISQVRQRMRIRKMRFALVEKKYAFHGLGDVPDQTQYVNAMYSFEDVPFSRNSSGQTYEKVFGTRSSALEIFILERDLRGPCWLFVPNTALERKITWCKLELEAQNQKDIQIVHNVPPPPLRVMSLAIQTTLTGKKQHEVACLSCVISDNVALEGENVNLDVVNAFSMVRKIDNAPYPFDLDSCLTQAAQNIKRTNNERELLNLFTAKVQQWDPDVVVSHKLFDFTLDVLFHRMESLKINQWSKIGRLRRNKMPFYNGRIRKHAVGCGRLMACTFMSSQEFVHEKTYTLSNLADQYLNIKNHSNIDATQMKLYWSNSRDLIKVAIHCQNDALIILRLMSQLQILPLTKQLTNLCGNIWQKSLLSQRAERNEYLLLHEFVRDGYIVPEKYTKEEKLALGITREKQKTKREAQYKGGMVLEPKVGLYDKFVILLDFNSLYPSIIQEYNLCFTTVPHYRKDVDAEKNPEAFRPATDTEIGVLPKTIGVLLDRRSEVKKMMKRSRVDSERSRFDIRQKALKLVANSMYGCLGFENSRFYCKPIASLITAFGRQNLELAADAATAVDDRLRVIYGDTDSIMVYTDSASLSEARRMGREVKKQVNKTYTKMYLELDDVFTKVLLLRKKKYATLKLDDASRGNAVMPSVNENEFTTATQCAKAMGYSCKREVKGLDLVRRDWAVLSKEIGQEVLDIILSDESVEEVVTQVHECLRVHGEAIKENRVALEKYVVTKKLTKHPCDYPDKSKQAHVQVAIQMDSLGLQVNVGDVIPYIICVQSRSGAQTKSLASRAYHMEEIIRSQRQSIGAVTKNGDEKETDGTEQKQESTPVLEVDRTWYLENQILPPIGRYCSPIEGTDLAQLASCLGLDSRKYHQASRNAAVHEDGEDEDEDSFLFMAGNPHEMYANCEKLMIRCSYCKIEIVFSGCLKFELDASSGFRCPSPNCRGLIDQQNEENCRRDVKRLKNSIERRIRTHVNAYYDRVWKCRDPTCQHTVRQLPLRGPECPKPGCSSYMLESYSASELYTQIRYFSYLFDADRAKRMWREEAKEKPQYQCPTSGQLNQIEGWVADQLHKFIEKDILGKSKYNFLSVGSLFKYFTVKR